MGFVARYTNRGTDILFLILVQFGLGNSCGVFALHHPLRIVSEYFPSGTGYFLDLFLRQLIVGWGDGNQHISD